MRTVLISGGESPVPDALRALVERGSTSLEERAASAPGEPLRHDVDRLVFWSAGADRDITALAEASAAKEATERREVIVFVSGEAAPPPIARLSPNECYVWPRDEDRLKMAFLTGA